LKLHSSTKNMSITTKTTFLISYYNSCWNDIQHQWHTHFSNKLYKTCLSLPAVISTPTSQASKYEVFTMVLLKTQVSWDKTLYYWV
jgi:hypothetical protein